MEKTELREKLIDFIIMYLSPKGEMVGKSELGHKAKSEYGRPFKSDPLWNRFYDSVIVDMTSPSNDVLLIEGGSLIGLSDLGRRMGEAGGYIAYRKQMKIRKITERVILLIYYISASIAALVASGIIHFSKNHEVAVPSIGFVLFWAVMGGVVRDIIPRFSKIISQLLNANNVS